MNVMPIHSVSISPIEMPETAITTMSPSGPAFMQTIGAELDQVNVSLNQADAATRALAAGQDIPVQDVMIAMEHAHLKLQFAVEVRNRIIDAYQNLTNMQV
jgi:flagellar hook-basal body complex protein FliE